MPGGGELRAEDPGRGLGRKLRSQRARSLYCRISSVLKVVDRSGFRNILQSGKAVLTIEKMHFILFTYL